VKLGIPGRQQEGPMPHIPLNRPGEPYEAAASILLLACPLSSYITGHTLEVTGGVGI